MNRDSEREESLKSENVIYFVSIVVEVLSQIRRVVPKYYRRNQDGIYIYM